MRQFGAFNNAGMWRRGSTGVSMPAGALGIWYADRYSATPRPHVPNSAATSAVPKNLFSAPRRQFANVNYFFSPSCTVTDLNATDQNLANEAATITWGSADAGMLSGFSAALPAGTYTLSVDVRTTDASTVGFRMGMNASMATKSATPAWQTFSTTFTQVSGAPNIYVVRSVNTSTPANLAIDNVRMHAGSVDLGMDTVEGTLMLGQNAYLALPTSSGGLIDTSAAGEGLVQFLTAQAITGSFTLVCVGKRISATLPATEQAFLSKVQDGHQFIGNYTGAYIGITGADGGAPSTWLGGTQRITTGGPSIGLYNPNANQMEMYATRYDGTNTDVFSNDSRLIRTSPGAVVFTAQDLYFNRTSFGSANARYAMQAMALYPSALSQAQIEQVYAALKSRLAINFNIETKFVCAEGDSITWGSGGTSNLGYASLGGALCSPAVLGINKALNSAKLAGNGGNSLFGRQADVNALLPTNKRGRTYVLSVLIGRNDLIGYSGGAAQYAADLSVYLLQQKAAGWDKIILGTLPPSTAATYNGLRNTFNGIVTAPAWMAANGVDAIVDYAADPTYGTDADASDVAKYADGTHPTPLTYGAMATRWAGVVSAV